MFVTLAAEGTEAFHQWVTTVLAIGAGIGSIASVIGVFYITKSKVDDNIERVAKLEVSSAEKEKELTSLTSKYNELRRDYDRQQGQIEESRKNGSDVRDRLTRIETLLEVMVKDMSEMRESRKET